MSDHKTVVFARTVVSGHAFAAQQGIRAYHVVTPRNFRSALRGVWICEDLVAEGDILEEITPQMCRYVYQAFINARTDRGAEVYRWLWERATTVE